MDPISAAAQDMLQTSSSELRELVSSMDEALLNEAPAPGTNAIAVLVAHAVSSARWLVDAALTGRMDRERYMREDRPAAFATRGATRAQLLTLIDDLDRTAARVGDEGPRADYAGEVTYATAETGPSRTRAWSLIHAVEHLREHVAHAQLTRQVLEAGAEQRATGNE